MISSILCSVSFNALRAYRFVENKDIVYGKKQEDIVIYVCYFYISSHMTRMVYDNHRLTTTCIM